MRREYARSLRGQRVTGTRPFRTISLIGAIRLGERPKIMTSKTSVNGAIFLRFVKTRLAPWIYPGDIVVMDNISIRKMRVVSEAIGDAGGLPVYLRTYSPELNPIERLWADMKRRLRTLALNAQDELLQLSDDSARRPRSQRSPHGFVIPYPRLGSTDLGVSSPAHHVPREKVEDDCDIKPAGQRPDVRHVGHPSRVFGSSTSNFRSRTFGAIGPG
jgi:transposase